ncbi:MAG TPA: alginate lyase family protein, partial [Steroidobacteraceae bacterium]|nr:alginate lyase family protein [Steroidobacteraceae bacterium]
MRKPPGYVVRRMAAELHRELDRFTQSYRARTFTVAALCARTGEGSAAQLWQRLATQPWPVPAARVAAEDLERLRPGGTRQILERAAAAARHEVNLLGSGVVALGPQISWDVDFKSGARWPPRYFRDIPVLNAKRPSDIKVPWELSRLQWLVPVGQAYLLSGDERHAVCAREVLQQWLAANPIGRTVNWALAMEPAMRIFTWTWLFRVFARSAAWEAPEFRERFLCSLYEHAQFVARHLERADVNGNHFTADCAALLVAGAFFGGEEADRWFDTAHADLEREIVTQILGDGADFEASAAYHRFVAELFLIAALHAENRRPVSAQYRARLAGAARFTAAYTRPDGSAPLWGDADDARALPFGTAPVTDHRHLVACTALFLGDADLGAAACGGWDEALWLFGRGTPSALAPPGLPRVEAFAAVGAYVLRAPGAHVFVDCGPVGLAGRGGHGHNDALSFEAVLGGIPVVSDPGCYLYTASFEERNHFRSTAVHSTPQIDGEEINRFVSPDLLWLLHEDARPLDPRVCVREGVAVFEGAHTGYRRLRDPVEPWRGLELRADGMELRIEDSFRGSGSHEVSI